MRAVLPPSIILIWGGLASPKRFLEEPGGENGLTAGQAIALGIVLAVVGAIVSTAGKQLVERGVSTALARR